MSLFSGLVRGERGRAGVSVSCSLLWAHVSACYRGSHHLHLKLTTQTSSYNSTSTWVHLTKTFTSLLIHITLPPLPPNSTFTSVWLHLYLIEYPYLPQSASTLTWVLDFTPTSSSFALHIIPCPPQGQRLIPKGEFSDVAWFMAFCF